MPIYEEKQQPVLTEEKKKAISKSRIKFLVTGNIDRLIEQFNEIFNLVWDNPHGLTPQQVFDAFGTEAGDLFTVSSAIGSAILAVNPSWVPPTRPFPHVINQDNTVTVLAA